ncbi:MAG: N-acetylmuramoyl-L-alanine amidase [Verrucomicrobiales bacterium]|jgi:N-acetylmuramoyl-L-alanine amidase
MTQILTRRADYSDMAPSRLTRVHRKFFPLVPLLVLALSSPLAAQTADETPGLAPAVGPWAGAPRGQIHEITPGIDSITVRGITRDPDSAQSVSYQLLVDGFEVATGASPRPNGFGRASTFTESIRITPGFHRICLRLSDRQLGDRTVHCRNAVTAPPSRVDSALIEGARGVLVSPSGVVLPVLGGGPGNWRVTTPCGAETTLQNGRFIERARVVIDPGHGGSESGAVGGGLQEKNVNLAVSELVVSKFEALGITAQLTRTGDYRLPIKTRADIASGLAPDVFLSLHHNGGATRPSSRPGTEIFYSEARPESRRLAAVLYEEMNAAAAQFNASWVSTVSEGASLRLREDGKDLYGIHRFSPQINSVITEFLYLSNRSEAALMARSDVIDAEAQSIVDGIFRWWFTDSAGTTRGRQFTDSSSTGTGGFDGCSNPSLTSGSVGLSNVRESVLAAAAGRIPAPQPARSLLPALTLGADPAIGR